MPETNVGLCEAFSIFFRAWETLKGDLSDLKSMEWKRNLSEED